ncbi:cold shock domain-containing protein [Mycobacterium sp. AMU20-3851]|uniref:cold shock domain-containing protein n=1 Tax=Mycobacterium sp. AMU20-3851 TaxID=3122055 RepID=UPI0037549367
MATTGTVRFWHADLGWGVLDATETPGGCFAHYTQIQADADMAARGFRTLSDGQPVEFTWEQYPQDGYEFRVIAVWPATAVQG